MANLSMSSNKLSQFVLLVGFTAVLLFWSCNATSLQTMNDDDDDLPKATKNLMFMQKYQCSEPKPRTIRVQDDHNEPDKKFWPSYVLLHRCDSQSGCCDNAHQTCSPKTTEPVTLYFLVKKIVPSTNSVNLLTKLRNKSRSKGENNLVEHRQFINHTECHCN